MGEEMNLGAKQERFSYMLMQLLVFIHSKGYKIRFGHAQRCENCVTGHKNSLHKLKLAVDLNLLKDNVLLEKSEEHLEPGLYWESIGGTWGGRWGDGNHYSLSYRGMK